MSSKTQKSWYHDSDILDEKRKKGDIIFEIIVNNDDVLTSVINSIVDELCRMYPNMSNRLKTILHTIRDSTQEEGARVLKHGLLFFALANEQWVVDILASHGKIPPERYELFFKDSLVPSSQKLLNGIITSLWAYVEQVRGEYMIS